MREKKLIFKRGPRPSGLYAVGQPYAQVDILLGKEVVGFITPPSKGLAMTMIGMTTGD